MFNDYINALSPKYINYGYKYVARQYYKSATKGVLRISPYQEFRKYEDFRGDQTEGFIKYESLGILPPWFLATNPFDRAYGSVTVDTYGCSYEIDHPPAFILCLSSEVDNPGLTTPDSDQVLKIKSLGTLAKRVSDRYSDRLGDYRVEPVNYGPKIHLITNKPYSPPDLFTKESRFSEDKEIRIAWLAHNQDLYEPFLLEEGLISDLIDQI